MDETIEWLLEGEPWVALRTRLDLLGESKEDPMVHKTREAMLNHPKIATLLDELLGWNEQILKSHKSSGHQLHKLVFLADLGLLAEDINMGGIIEKVMTYQSKEGIPQIKVNINPKYGGTGEDQYVWMLCDAPSVLYSLVKFGLGDSEMVQQAVAYLSGLARDNGYPCAVSPDLGKFRGPGRKADPCPYANLLMIKLLAQIPAYHESAGLKIGVETLLSLWEQRKERRPYLFAMGSGFVKLKAPFVWYDILHVTDVLTQIPWVLKDPRLAEMITIVQSKMDANRRFTPESVWRDWKGWDFGQKKNPSRWVTFLVLRILQRMETAKTI
jgi:hypothetical protein